MRAVIRIAAIVLAAAGVLLALAGPLGAAEVDPSSRSFIVITGRMDVNEGETYQDAVIFDGDARIDGHVLGNVLALNGDVTVSGDVGGDVVALNGRVILESSAVVGADVVSKDSIDRAAGASVGGTVTNNGLPTNFHFADVAAFSRVALWVGSSVSSLALGLLLLLFAPRAGEAVAAVASSRFGRSIGTGFAVFFGIPIAAVILFATVVGIPLSVGVLLALALLYWIGYVAAALALGRMLVKPPTSRMLAFLAGWGILRIFALVPVLGGFPWFLAAVFGLGAIAVAARRSGRDRQDRGVVAQVGTPPPMPPMPTP
jgi:hypothetical protein